MKRRGFSLVEIAISLGIFAFCLLAVMGLFASGLRTEQNSQEEEGAAAVLAALSVALENSHGNTNGMYAAASPLNGWTWDPAAGGVTNGILGDYAYWVRLKLGSSTGDSRLISARLELAWPAKTAQWDNNGHASSTKGATSSRVLFFLR